MQNAHDGDKNQWTFCDSNSPLSGSSHTIQLSPISENGQCDEHAESGDGEDGFKLFAIGTIVAMQERTIAPGAPRVEMDAQIMPHEVMMRTNPKLPRCHQTQGEDHHVVQGTDDHARAENVAAYPDCFAMTPIDQLK